MNSQPGAAAVVEVPSAVHMRELGQRLARQLRAGDVVVLSGALGVGKTTLTQGIGEGLGVRGPITSPTFVIARVHPTLRTGPALVHVDAYRLGSLAEVDDLDLDTEVADAVTVIEWGEGKTEQLAENRLEILVQRAGQGGEARRVTVRAVGDRWHWRPPADIAPADLETDNAAEGPTS